MKKKTLFWSIFASLLGLLVSVLVLPKVYIDGSYFAWLKTILFAGLVLGCLNYFLKPALGLLTAPLKILTFGLFGIILNMLIIWGVDILFPSLHIKGILYLFLTTLIIWLANLLTPKKK
ncbi:phage holin family protein [Candidatus Gribaldobacteria bacterium]|nr:phage holin family protein [Candidatus Gribaldobacteria bacterium]